MSRYSLPAQNPALTVVVGWDNKVLIRLVLLEASRGVEGSP